MALTAEEKMRATYHLGYMGVQSAASLSYGIPRPIQTLFLVEVALNNLMPIFEDKVRRIINIMDGVECRLVDAQERLAASQLDSLKTRADEPQALEIEYQRWGLRLADTLGVPPYYYSTRYKRQPGQRGGNVPVSG
jgi:hypothetical protein